MSQAVIMSTPPPTQAEWTQAITGFIHCRGGGGGGEIYSMCVREREKEGGGGGRGQ